MVMKAKKGGDLICKRPEQIIAARYNLSKKQNDIIDMVFASIDESDKLQYEIDLSKYGILYNIKDRSNIYRDLKKAALSFGKNEGFELKTIYNGHEAGTVFHWFSSITYIDGESRIIFGLDQILKQIMLNAKHASFYNIKYPINFHNTYSKKIYYILKSYENSNKDGTGWHLCYVDELRNSLYCPKTYDNYSDFKRCVLTPAYQEINNDSDISFEYEEIRKGAGGKISQLKFNIKINNYLFQLPTNNLESGEKSTIPILIEGISPVDFESPEILNQIEIKAKEIIQINSNTKIIKNIFKHIRNMEISEKAANEIYICATKHKKYGNEPLKLIEEVAVYSKGENIKKGIIGWFKPTVENYEPPIKSRKVDKFNDYEQRTYNGSDGKMTINELENNLLGYRNE